MKFLPSIGADYSGSLAGITASRNRYGSYFRQKSAPVNPNTTRQQAVRSIFATLVNVWTSTLTAAQRAAWSTYAANTPFTDGLGNQTFVTGQNMYVRSNVARLQAGLARVDTAPTMFNLGEPVTSMEAQGEAYPGVIGIDEAGSTLSQRFTVSGGASDDGDILFAIGEPINDSRNFFKGPYQLAAVGALASAATSAVFLTTFANLLNASPLVLGQYRGVRVRVAYDDGRLTEPFEVLGVVTDDIP